MDTDTIANLAQVQNVLHPQVGHAGYIKIYQECAAELGLPVDPERELTAEQAEALYALAEDA